VVRRPWRRTGRLLEKKSDRSAKSIQTHLIPPFSSYDAFDGTEVNKKLRQIAGYDSGKELLDQKIREDIAEETRPIGGLIIVAPRSARAPGSLRMAEFCCFLEDIPWPEMTASSSGPATALGTFRASSEVDV